MARHRCNACGAEYRDTQRDGTAYFHACGPDTIVTGRRDNGQAIEQPLRSFAGITLVPDEAAKADLVAAGVLPAAIVVEIERRLEPRPNARDENTLRREGDGGRTRVLKAEGAGVTLLADPAPAPRG